MLLGALARDDNSVLPTTFKEDLPEDCLADILLVAFPEFPRAPPPPPPLVPPDGARADLAGGRVGMRRSASCSLTASMSDNSGNSAASWPRVQSTFYYTNM
jgi:hypothetical protein